MRLYKKDGKKLPSVTTITSQLDKPALTYWAANCACDYIIQEIPEIEFQTETINGEGGYDTQAVSLDDLYPLIESARKNFRKVSAKALDIGSAVHKAIERYLKTGQEPQAPSEEVLSAFLAFLEWKDSVEMVAIKTEHTLYSEKYAGTCDLICLMNGKYGRTTYLVDFKSSKGIYDEMVYQVAAYRACNMSVEGCGILRLDKETGMPEWKDTSDTYTEDLAIFNTLCELWWLRNPNPR